MNDFTSSERKNASCMYLSDSAIHNEDSFGIHTSISDTLFKIIKQHDVSSESFTIGLFGQWGSGKSFIINQLKNRIEKELADRAVLLYVDVWKYSGFPLLRSILFVLNEQLTTIAKNHETENKFAVFTGGYKRKDGKDLQSILYYDEAFESESSIDAREFNKKLRYILSKYIVPFSLLFLVSIIFIFFHLIPDELKSSSWYSIIHSFLSGMAALTSFIGIGGVFLGLLHKPLKDLGELVFFRNTIRNYSEKANFSPEQFEEIYKDMLLRIKDTKFVIVFDNVDRCEPSYAYETLSTIKTFMDVTNCFYIITCDDEAIKKHIASRLEQGEFSKRFSEEFVDKLFQTYIRIPTLKEVDRDNYIREMLERIDIGKELYNDIKIITEILYYAYRGETPRNIKRFINDFATYYLLAQISHPKLLKNIMLFTIIVAIKQKWNKFESYLIDNPTLFKDIATSLEIPTDVDNNLKSFLRNINFYIRDIANESVAPYIHFKKTEPDFEIAEMLRSGNYDLELNAEKFKILQKEFSKNSLKPDSAYAYNAFLSWANLLTKNKTSGYYPEIVVGFWKHFETAKIKQSELIKELNKLNILKDVLDSLAISNAKHLRSFSEQIFSNFVKEVITQDEKTPETEVYKEVFEVILNSEYQFSSSSITAVFSDWNITNEYQKELLQSISEKKRYDYLPEDILDNVVKEMDKHYSEALDVLQCWGYNRLPENTGKEVVVFFIKKAPQVINVIANQQSLLQQWDQIENLYSNLGLINESFLDDNTKNLVSAVNVTIAKILQFSTPDKKDKAIDFWYELAYFANLNNSNNNMDAMLTNHFNTFKNQNLLDNFRKELRYPENLLSLTSLKKQLYQDNEVIKRVYEVLEKKHLSDYKLLFILPLDLSNIKAIAKLIEYKDKTALDKNKLAVFMINKLIEELKNNQSASPADILKYLADEFKQSPIQGIIKKHANLFIDLYKNTPIANIGILYQISRIIPPQDLEKDFVIPLLKFVKTKLESTESVGQYDGINNLVPKKLTQEAVDLCWNIFKETLKNNQELEENYFGINLLAKISTGLSAKQQNEAKKILSENDNRTKWDNELIEKLKEIELLEKENIDDSEKKNT